MSDKLDKVVDAISAKTNNNDIEWDRMKGSFEKQNPFYRQYIMDNYFNYDGMNCYVAEYNNGYIYYTKSPNDKYGELSIQPSEDTDLTILASSGSNKKLEELENTIKNKIDNPDDFINSLLK